MTEPTTADWKLQTALLVAQVNHVEVERDEVVRLLRGLPARPCVQTGDYPMETPCVLNCVACRVVFFLASLTTVTPEDWEKHQAERAQNVGKSEAELREQYGLPAKEPGPKVDVIYMTRDQVEWRESQPCERVSVMTAVGARYRYYICATHGKPWGECEVKTLS